MAEVATLPPLAPPASPPPPPSEGAAEPSPAQASPRQRLPVHLRHTASSRSQALVDPESETAGEIRALMRREPPPAAGGRLPQLGAGGAADYVRHGGDNLRELVARKRQVGGGGERCNRAAAVPAALPGAPRAGTLLLLPGTTHPPACISRPPPAQIFLAQMSLDTKHGEIAKLEARAHQREEALMVGAAGGQGEGGWLVARALDAGCTQPALEACSPEAANHFAVLHQPLLSSRPAAAPPRAGV